MLAVRPELDVPRSSAAEPVNRDLCQPGARELERDEVDRVRLAIRFETARVAGVHGFRNLAIEIEEEIDEVDSAFEQRSVRHKPASASIFFR